MKSELSLVQLAQEIQNRAASAEDVIADTRQIELTDEGQLAVQGRSPVPVTDFAHGQVAAHAEIPKPYYDRMRQQAPSLLADNVNHWLRANPARRMVRFIGEQARAFLSDRYRRFDYVDLAQAVLPPLLEGDVRIVSCALTETRMFIKAVFPKIEGEVRVGDVVQSGIVISNSEVGAGSVSVQPLIYRLVCTNGMIANNHGLKTAHLGRRIDGAGDNPMVLFRDETLAADDKALALKLADIVRAASSASGFERLLEDMRDATSGPEIERPIRAVEVLTKTFSLTQAEGDSVLNNLIKNGDLTRWGAINAVTEVANTHDSYDRATALETAGGRLLDLPANQWESIANAA